ncbi:hypothetical protein HU200_024956 [Digitaria exilis]|uniref:Uncharacterized protein n=1 Tax=Digitaria exilis TaxID=1010633 RepID=A0A835C9A2_9POAL|nr:hypothetical protein HU200_024956 [Digitaria exilis]
MMDFKMVVAGSSGVPLGSTLTSTSTT